MWGFGASQSSYIFQLDLLDIQACAKLCEELVPLVHKKANYAAT